MYILKVPVTVVPQLLFSLPSCFLFFCFFFGQRWKLVESGHLTSLSFAVQIWGNSRHSVYLCYLKGQVLSPEVLWASFSELMFVFSPSLLQEPVLWPRSSRSPCPCLSSLWCYVLPTPHPHCLDILTFCLRRTQFSTLLYPSSYYFQL